MIGVEKLAKILLPCNLTLILTVTTGSGSWFPVENGWYRIRSTKGTVLDDWGGKTGENSAALQPDTDPNSDNRKWELVPVGNNWFRIRSKKGTVLDNWGGKTGENSAALQPDDDPNSENRKWQFIV
jgi:hypothetical protein